MTKLLCLVALGLACLAHGSAAFGAQNAPDPGKPFDLQGFIDKAVAAGQRRIVIPPGRHRVVPSKREHLRLQGLRDLEIIADGAELVCTQTTRAITIEDCEKLTLRGLTIDYDPLPYTQGRIVAVSDDTMVHEIELFEGYLGSDKISGEKYEIFRGDDRTLRFGSYHEVKVEKLSPTRIRVRKAEMYRGERWRKGEQPDDIIAIACKDAPGGRSDHAVALRRSSDVTLEGITLYASPVFGFVEEGCAGTTYLRCRVDRRLPAQDLRQRADARIRSLNADAFHSIGATRGPSYLECTAHFMGDDAVNIHGNYHLLMQAEGTRLRVLARGNLDLRPGDPLEILTPEGIRLPEAKVVSAEPDGELRPDERAFLDTQKSLNSVIKMSSPQYRLWRVTLDRPAEAPRGCLIGAANRMGSGFRVVGCHFGFNRSRGILIKASRGLISGNSLEGCWGAAIKVSPEWFWLESGSSDDLTIEKNRLTNCKNAAIAVYGNGARSEFPPAGLHNRIRIAGNTIEHSPMPGIIVTSTRDLTLSDNAVTPDPAIPPDPDVLRTFRIRQPDPVALIKVEEVKQ